MPGGCTIFARASNKTFVSCFQKRRNKTFLSQKFRKQCHSLAEISLYMISHMISLYMISSHTISIYMISVYEVRCKNSVCLFFVVVCLISFHKSKTVTSVKMVQTNMHNFHFSFMNQVLYQLLPIVLGIS